MEAAINNIDKILEEISPGWQADLEGKLHSSRNDRESLQVDFNPQEPKKANSDTF